MKKAGINWLAFGIESGSSKVRKGVSKSQFSDERIKDVVQMVHDADINIVANFIFGLPDDDVESMQKTLDMAKELNCAYTNFYCAMAYPGSSLYNECISSGVKMPETWSGFSQFSFETLPLPTKHLTGEEVLKFRDNAFHDIHSSEKYLNMINEKFDDKTVEHIKKMLEYKIKRKHIKKNVGIS